MSMNHLVDTLLLLNKRLVALEKKGGGKTPSLSVDPHETDGKGDRVQDTLNPHETDGKGDRVQQEIDKNERLATMVRQFRQSWQIITQKHMDFVFLDRHYRYISPPEPSLIWGHFLNNLLPYNPTVVDPYAGVGLDGAIPIMYKLNPQELVLGQPSESDTGDLTFRLLQRNVREFQKKMPGIDVGVRFYNTTAENLMNSELPTGSIWDVLYLDPDWFNVDYKGSHQELNEDGLFDKLYREVFHHANTRNIQFRFVVMKSRFTGARLQGFINQMNRGRTLQYALEYSFKFNPFRENSVPVNRSKRPTPAAKGDTPGLPGVKGVFYQHILRLQTPLCAVWDKSDGYRRIYARGAKALNEDEVRDIHIQNEHRYGSYAAPGAKKGNTHDNKVDGVPVRFDGDNIVFRERGQPAPPNRPEPTDPNWGYRNHKPSEDPWYDK